MDSREKFDTKEIFRSTIRAAISSAVDALCSRSAKKQISKLNKGILDKKGIKREAVKIEGKFNILGKRIKYCIGVSEKIYDFFA